MLPNVFPLLEAALFDVPSTDDLFNPYHDRRADLDRPEAVYLRRENLRAYVAAYTAVPPLFLLAEAPGPWGCRFSGVPLVSEAQLVDPAFPLSGHPTSLGEPHTEYSANIYWRTLGPYFPHFFTWNSVPFHPHKLGAPLTIRTPRQREVNAFTGLLADLLGCLRPARTLAVGRKAEHALKKAGFAATYVRHPSQGGARLFAEAVEDICGEMGLARSS